LGTECQKEEIIKFLLAKDANPNAKDIKGISAATLYQQKYGQDIQQLQSDISRSLNVSTNTTNVPMTKDDAGTAICNELNSPVFSDLSKEYSFSM
jgi:hypothetical protein